MGETAQDNIRAMLAGEAEAQVNRSLGEWIVDQVEDSVQEGVQGFFLAQNIQDSHALVKLQDEDLNEAFRVAGPDLTLGHKCAIWKVFWA